MEKALTPLRVLIVEDSEDDTELVLRELKKGGYDPIFKRVETAETMRAALKEEPWEIIIADFRMPHFNGLAALALLQETGLEIPSILVSGTIGEETAVEAMRLGIRDYVMKWNLPRLVPAVQRELHEAEMLREQKKLKQLQDNFIATLSHEIRTSMGIVREGVGQVLDGVSGGGSSMNNRGVLSRSHGMLWSAWGT